MNKLVCKFLSPLILFTLYSVETSAASLTDPYEILNNHYAAIGGLDRLKAETSTYFEADFTLVGMGLEGTLKQWTQSPVQTRQELDLKIVQQTSGDNGETAWMVDSNGKLKIMKDEETIKKRMLDKLMSEYVHLDPESPHFSVTFEGIEEVDGKDCYTVKIANDIMASEQTFFISTDDFLLAKSINFDNSGSESQNSFSDYREVNGVLHAFTQKTNSVSIHQVQQVSITKMETNIEIDPALFDAPAEKAEDFQFTDGNSSENVPFFFHENHIYLYVTINCDKQLWVLDSGAGATVIDKVYAKELGMAMEGNITGQGAGNTIELSLTTLPPFTVEGIQFNEQRAVSLDLEMLFKQLGDRRVAGILGYDFTSRFVTKIDYANELISFYHPDAFSYTGEGSIIEAPLNENNMFTLPMTVEGKFAGQWRFDTGATGSAFHYNFAKSNGLLDRPGIDRQAFGAGGSHNTRRFMMSGATIGGFALPQLVMGVPLEEGHGAMASKSLIGNLGSNVFRNFVIYMDYERQQIILEKGDDFGREFPMLKSGIQIWHPGGEDRVEIRFIAPGTPGEKAGFQVDDRILAINQIPVEQLDGLHAIRELMRAEAGTTYHLKILREGEVLTIQLTLADLY